MLKRNKLLSRTIRRHYSIISNILPVNSYTSMASTGAAENSIEISTAPNSNDATLAKEQLNHTANIFQRPKMSFKQRAPKYTKEREIMQKAKDFDYKRVYEMLENTQDKTKVLSKIYLEQRYYGKVLEISNEKLQRIESFTRMGYLDRALSDLKTKQEFTTALAGFTRIKSKRKEMELLWEKIKEVYDLDLYLYNTIMRGYIMHQEYDKVWALYNEMLNSFRPDKYTYSIISMCYLQSQDRRFLNILRECKHLESDISRSFELIFKVRNNQLEFNDTVDRLSERPSLLLRPELVSSLLAALIKQNNPNVHHFVEYLLENKVPPSARLYSLLILLCGRTAKAAYDAWPLYEQMKRKQIPPNEKVFTNLLGIGVKTNAVKNLYALMEDITQTLHPRSFYRDCLELFACVRPGCVDYDEQCKRNLQTLEPIEQAVESQSYEPYVQDFPKGIKPRKKKNIDSGQQHYTSLAIILMQDMLNRNVFPHPTHFYSILRNALITKGPASNNNVRKLYGLFQKIPDPENDFESQFCIVLFNSSRWDIVGELSTQIREFNEILGKSITEHGDAGNYAWLYTLATNFEMNSSLSSLVLENIGIKCQEATYLDAAYKNIITKTETVTWSYARSLIWLGHHQKAVTVATFDYNENYDGIVVKELLQWFRERKLEKFSGEMATYWRLRRPDWIV